MILINLTGFYEIFWPVSRPMIFLGRKYFYRATVESYGLEVVTEVRVRGTAGSNAVLQK